MLLVKVKRRMDIFIGYRKVLNIVFILGGVKFVFYEVK